MNQYNANNSQVNETNTAKTLRGGYFTSTRPLYRPTWVEISRLAIRNNLKNLKSKIKNNAGIIAIVKANAYGHMAVPIAHILEESPVDALAVSSIEEGIDLRKNGIKKDILVLGSLFPLDNLNAALDFDLVPSIASLYGLEEYDKICAERKVIGKFHLKVDTGMGRIGVAPSSAIALLDKLISFSNIRLAGIYTHFASSDFDKKYTLKQLNRFSEVVKMARLKNFEFSAHTANSAALIKYPKTHFDYVRPGLSLYGMWPSEDCKRKIKLDPVLSWKTKVVFVKRVSAGTFISYGRTYKTKKTSTIATLPVGYADGYSRHLTNKGKVLIHGKKCPVLGRITMDMIMVDVSSMKNVEVGDEAVLIGKQGNQQITAEEMARLAGTINYEITCNISPRVPRIIL